jgi:hypothetical protein
LSATTVDSEVIVVSEFWSICEQAFLGVNMGVEDFPSFEAIRQLGI